MADGYVQLPADGAGKRLDAWEKPSATAEYVQSTRNDLTLNATPKRYMISLSLPGVATAGTNICGLRKLNANADVYITYVRVDIYGAAAFTSVPIRFYRGTTVAGGTQITAADIPKLDTAAGDATLEVRTGAVTGTKANQVLFHGSALANLAAGGGGMGTEYTASIETGMRWRLTADEGIIVDMSVIGDTDTRYLVTFQWEEV